MVVTRTKLFFRMTGCASVSYYNRIYLFYVIDSPLRSIIDLSSDMPLAHIAQDEVGEMLILPHTFLAHLTKLFLL